MNKHFKDATKKLAETKADNHAKQLKLETLKLQAQLEKERQKITSDWECCVEKIVWDTNYHIWDKIDDVDEIKTTISKFEKYLDNFYQIRSDLKLYYGVHMSICS